VENDVILEGMYRQLVDVPNIEILNESKIENCNLPKDGKKHNEVTLKSGETFTCSLLVS